MISTDNEYSYAVVVNVKNKEINNESQKIKTDMSFLFLSVIKRREIRFLKIIFDSSIKPELYAKLFNETYQREKLVNDNFSELSKRNIQEKFADFEFIKCNDFESSYENDLSRVANLGGLEVVESNLLKSVRRYSYFDKGGHVSTFNLFENYYRILGVFNDVIPVEIESVIGENARFSIDEFQLDKVPSTLSSLNLNGKIMMSVKSVYQLITQLLNLLPVEGINKENFLTEAKNELTLSEHLSIFDSPTLNTSNNNYYFDFTGKNLKEKPLIEKGKFKDRMNNEFISSKCSFDNVERFTNILVDISNLVYTETKWYITEFSFNSFLNPQTGIFTGIAYAYKTSDSNKKLYATPVNFSVTEVFKHIEKNEEIVYKYKNLWSPNLIVDL